MPWRTPASRPWKREGLPVSDPLPETNIWRFTESFQIKRNGAGWLVINSCFSDYRLLTLPFHFPPKHFHVCASRVSSLAHWLSTLLKVSSLQLRSSSKGNHWLDINSPLWPLSHTTAHISLKNWRQVNEAPPTTQAFLNNVNVTGNDRGGRKWSSCESTSEILRSFHGWKNLWYKLTIFHNIKSQNDFAAASRLVAIAMSFLKRKPQTKILWRLKFKFGSS